MRQLVNQPRSPPSTRQPSSPPALPPPRVLVSPSTGQVMAQTTPHVPIHDLRPKPTEKPSKPTARTKPTQYAIPIVEPDDERDEIPTTRPASPPRRTTTLFSSRTSCSISRQALYHVIGLGCTNAPANTVLTSLAKHHKQYTGPLIDTEEYCYGVVHPVTNETITHYRKLIKDPLLKELWLKAMSKELHRLAQGYTGVTKGTNTIFYLSHADICKIPHDRTVTYARIVIDH